MQNKLQELTDRLYEEGLAKGKAEGEKLVAEAQKKAEEIVAKAREEAAKIVEQASKEAAQISSKTDSDVKMAASQALQATKKELEDLLVSGISAAPVNSALADSGFVKEIIKAVASKFSADQASDIALVLPESLKKDLEPFVKNELRSILGKEVSATFSKKVRGGFTIGPKDGSYFISLTDETFNDLICEYLRPVTRKLLFG